MIESSGACPQSQVVGKRSDIKVVTSRISFDRQIRLDSQHLLNSGNPELAASRQINCCGFQRRRASLIPEARIDTADFAQHELALHATFRAPANDGLQRGNSGVVVLSEILDNVIVVNRESMSRMHRCRGTSYKDGTGKLRLKNGRMCQQTFPVRSLWRSSHVRFRANDYPSGSREEVPRMHVPSNHPGPTP